MSDNDPVAKLSHEARELYFYLCHGGREVYNAYYLPQCRSLKRHKDRGTFNRERGIKGMLHGVNGAAKRYHLEHGSWSISWHKLFSASDRERVAEIMVDIFLDEYREGCDFKA